MPAEKRVKHMKESRSRKDRKRGALVFPAVESRRSPAFCHLIHRKVGRAKFRAICFVGLTRYTKSPARMATAIALAFAAGAAAVLLRQRSQLSNSGQTRRRRRLYVVRHGQKESNKEDSDNFELSLLPEASESLGALHKYLDAAGIHFDAMLSSPFRRCRQTASILAPSCTLTVEPGLSECLNEKTGLRDGSAAPPTLSKIVRRIEKLMEIQNTPAPLIAAKELERDVDDTFLQCMQRSCRFVERLSTAHVQHSDLLLVGHGASSIGLINACLRGKAFPFLGTGCPPMGSMTVLEEIESGSGGLGGFRAVGHILTVPGKGGGWSCQWGDGPAGGADPNQL